MERVAGNANRLVANGQNTKDAERVLAAIKREKEDRKRSFLSATASEKVQKVFSSPLLETEEKVLRALLAYPDSTSDELSEHVGYKRSGGWHLHFGTMCKKRLARYIDAPASDARDNAEFYTGILADFDPVNRTFRFKPDIEPSIRALLS